MNPPVSSVVERVFRDEHAQVFAALVQLLRDFDAADEALGAAYAAALENWERSGVPDKPGAWILTVARNAASSARRHEAVADRKGAELAAEVGVAGQGPWDETLPDERLRLIFTCCHPALSEEAQVALTLWSCCGVSTPQIARLFLVPEATVAQRLVRAKRKIRDAGIPFAMPDDEQLPARRDAVLAVVYLLFTAGYAPSDADVVLAAPLCEEAIRLGQLLARLMPRDAEVGGLLALMMLHHARRDGRVDASGELVALEEQDRSRWDGAEIQEGLRRLDEALARGQPGPYQIQAAIAALHATAAQFKDTDWPQIAGLYEALWQRDSSAAVALNLAIAVGMAEGPAKGLERLDAFEKAGAFVGHDRIPAARADLLRRAGRTAEAVAAYGAALERARNKRERVFLTRRLASLST